MAENWNIPSSQMSVWCDASSNFSQTQGQGQKGRSQVMRPIPNPDRIDSENCGPLRGGGVLHPKPTG